MQTEDFSRKILSKHAGTFRKVRGNKMKQKSSNTAIIIGVVCIATYLTNYYMRHILSVLTPRLLETGKFTVEHIGLLSSVYMFFYAAGQLVNGFIGDYISPRKLSSAGVFISGVVSIIFPFSGSEILHIALFAVFGFALSMVRGPFMKIISENTSPNQARTICIFFSFAGFAGPLIASLFAMVNNWQWVFVAAGSVSTIVSAVAYAFFTKMEQSGKITYKISKSQSFGSLLAVFKIDKFVFYMAIAALAEMGGVSISFWIPTFLTKNLLFSKDAANMIFTFISVMRSIVPFLTLIVFRLIKEKDIVLLRASFLVSTVLFVGMLLSQNRWITLLLLIVALMAMSCPSALLWSIYIPGLGKTGRVSSVNGILDCTGYIAAAVANILFAGIMSRAGWNTVILLWASIGVVGIIATLAVNKAENGVTVL